MAGVDISYDLAELGNITMVLNRVVDGLEVRDLLDMAGAVIESGSRRRIQHEKKSPKGKPWKPWAAAYARTRHAGHSLLSGRGDLLDSIHHSVEGDSAFVGSNLVYAAIHQFGGKAGRRRSVTIEARPYLGVSKRDAQNIADAFNSVAEEALHAR